MWCFMVSKISFSHVNEVMSSGHNNTDAHVNFYVCDCMKNTWESASQTKSSHREQR